MSLERDYKKFSPEFQHLYRRFRRLEAYMDGYISRKYLELCEVHDRVLLLPAAKSSTVETPVARSPSPQVKIKATQSFSSGNHFTWAPFKSIPNVKRFEVNLKGLDPLFGAFGLVKSNPPEMEFDSYKNQRFIRYAKVMITRLRTAKDPKYFWMLARIIMQRSVVFSLMAVSKSFPRYHRELPLSLVIRWIHGS